MTLGVGRGLRQGAHRAATSFSVVCGVVVDPWRRRMSSSSSVVVEQLGGVPGEAEEHVVQGRPAQADVLHRDAGGVQLADRRDEHGRSAVDRQRDPAGVRGRSAPRRRRAAPGQQHAASIWPPSAKVNSSRSPPTWALSSSAVPSAMTWPWSMTAISSASRSASSRYWVVSSRVVPPRTRSAMTSHMPSRLRGSRPGGRLVEEQHRRLGHQRGGEVEPAAHAAGVPLRRAPARLDQVEPLEQLVGPLPAPGAAEVVEPADHVEVLEAGEVLVDRGVLPGQADHAAQRPGVADDVEPGDRRASPRRARAAWSGSARRWSCRRRSGPADPARCPPAPPGPARAAPARRRRS